MSPKVSICIPAYRQIKFLKRTIESVLEQHFDNYEIVITDDSPEDSVKELVKEYLPNDRIKYHRNEIRLGSPENWNASVKMAQGEYIKILHHDDWFASPNSLAKFVEMLDSNPNADFAFSGAIAQPATKRKAWHHFASKFWLEELKKEPTRLFFQNIIGPPSSTIIRKSAFVEYDKNLVWMVDIAQYMQILCSHDFVATQEALIYSTTQAPHQLTSTCSKSKNINTYEHFYLFDSLRNHIPPERIKPYLEKLLETLLEYGVDSIDEIRDSGYKGVIPNEVERFFARSRIIKHYVNFKFKFKRLFKSIIRIIKPPLLPTPQNIK